MKVLHDLLSIATQYGLPGLLIIGTVVLLWRVIDRGIELSVRIPSRRSSG